MNGHSTLLESIVSYGNKDERICALVLVGSQAQEKGTDKYSDIDLIVVAQDTECFVDSNDWLSEIGKYHISFVEKIDRADEKRVLFEGALDVDFIIIPEHDAKQALANGVIGMILHGGYRVLVDKKGLRTHLPTQRQAGGTCHVPPEQTYKNAVNDFWFHAIWASKKLLRGELWAAKFCIDSYMKQKLLWMMEFYEHTRKGLDYNTGYNGRFVDTWAGDDIKQQLATTFAHYEKRDMIAALQKTMTLFRHLAVGVATANGYAYPVDADRYSSVWVEQNLPQSTFQA